MQDLMYSTKLGLEDMGWGRTKLRDIKEGGEALGIILTCRKCRRQCSYMNLSSSLLEFGNMRFPVVIACTWANKGPDTLRD